MDIDREMLALYYKNGDMNSFFKEAEKISNFLLQNYYKIYDKEKSEDMKQECLENLWKKIIQGKVDENKNLFAFIWRNSSFRILEILRKERNRKNKAQFFEYDEVDKSFFEYSFSCGDKYVSTIVKELSTVS